MPQKKKASPRKTGLAKAHTAKGKMGQDSSWWPCTYGRGSPSDTIKAMVGTGPSQPLPFFHNSCSHSVAPQVPREGPLLWRGRCILKEEAKVRALMRFHRH